MPENAYTDLEREVIILTAVVDLIDDMVNYNIFEKISKTKDMSLTFKTETHQRLFNILLVDMLSMPRSDDFNLPNFPDNASRSAGTFLYYLKLISQNPLMTENGRSLADPVDEFAHWLDAECVVENVWLGAIELEATIRVPRILFIKIVGDIAKHSFPRMSVNASRIRKLLANNGCEIDVGQAYLAMPEFNTWFSANVFSYHSSAIGEFLNNIRWGIYNYLLPEFRRSYARPDPNSPRYVYKYPDACVSELGRAKYWELMNWTRSEPYFPPFQVTKYLKMRY